MKTLKQMMNNIETEINEKWITPKGDQVKLFTPRDIKELGEEITDQSTGSVWNFIERQMNDAVYRSGAESMDENEVVDKLLKSYDKWKKGVNKLTKELLADAKKVTYEEWMPEVDSDTGEPRY